jgi:hypothetical protein
VDSRNRLLEFTNACGKWSLFNVFFMLLLMIVTSLSVDMSKVSPLDKILDELETDLRFTLYAEPTYAFHEFLGAVLLSLAVGLGISTCHRYVTKTGEFTVYDETADIDSRMALFFKMKHSRKLPKWLVAHGKSAVIATSIMFLLTGMFLKAYTCHFENSYGMWLEELTSQEYTLNSMREVLPEASKYPNSLGILWLQFFFFVFTACTAALYLVSLLALWTVPLSEVEQRRLLVYVQVFRTFNGLDVFVVTLAIVRLEAARIADNYLAELCQDVAISLEDLINLRLPCTELIEVRCQLHFGYFVLGLVALTCATVGRAVTRKCERHLGTSQRPLVVLDDDRPPVWTCCARCLRSCCGSLSSVTAQVAESAKDMSPKTRAIREKMNRAQARPSGSGQPPDASGDCLGIHRIAS